MSSSILRTLSALLLGCLLVVPSWAQDPLQQGSQLPPLPAGHTVADLAGPKGLVLMVFRSADW